MDWLDRQRVIGDLQIQSIIFFFPSKYFQLAFILSILASGTSSFVFLLPLQGILLSGRFSYLFSSYLVISGFLLLILSSPNLHLLFEWVHPRFSTKAPDSYNLLSIQSPHLTAPHPPPLMPCLPFPPIPLSSSVLFLFILNLTESRVLDAQHPCTVNHNVPLSLMVFHLFHPYCSWSTSGPFPFVRNIGQG